MRRENDWLHYVSTLSDQSRDLAQYANFYAKQWAHDVRCARSGITHRRVGEADKRNAHEAWLQAGYAVNQSDKLRR